MALSKMLSSAADAVLRDMVRHGRITNALLLPSARIELLAHDFIESEGEEKPGGYVKLYWRVTDKGEQYAKG